MKPVFFIAVSLLILSCQKQILPSPIEAEAQNNLSLSTAADSIVFSGHSQIQRMIYYNWKATWSGLPVTNTAVGGTTWKGSYVHIGARITSRRPRVIVLYQGAENEYNGYGLRADGVKPFFEAYYNEVRRQNPLAHIILVSMLKIPKLAYKGIGADIDKLNNYYRERVALDPNATYLDITQAYPSALPSPLWRPDSIHLNSYVPFYALLKPLVEAKFYGIDTVDVKPRAKRLFFGSSTAAQMDMTLFADSLGMTKAGFGGKTWIGLQALTDTIRKVGPAQVFIYSGANDYLAKRSVAQMTVDIQNLFRKVWSENPGIHLTYITTHPSDTAFKVIMKDGTTTAAQAIEYTNRNIVNWIRNYHSDSASVVDSYGSYLLWSPKRLNASYFGSDKLHLNRAGKVVLANLMAKAIN
jgi:lysophospholipase L1-like esterase